jgi:hypothetical protein
MKKLQMTIIATTLIIAVQAHAQLYDLTFTGAYGTDASGQIDVVGGLAVSGYLELTGNNQGTYTLCPGGPGSTYVLGYGEYSSISYDNLVFPDSDFFLDELGLGFADGPEGADGTQGFMLWYNGPNCAYNYAMFGDVGDGGNATLTPAPAAVPEPSTCVAGALMLLPLGIGAFRTFRKTRMA